MAFKKILCAVDFSECPREALSAAAELAAALDAALTLAYIWQAPLSPQHSALILKNELMAQVVDEAGEDLHRMRR